MKSLLLIILALGVFQLNPAWGTGPSVSGGVSEAPWARSYDVLSQVIKDLNDRHLEIDSVGFANQGKSVNAIVNNCDIDGTRTRLVYEITDDCQPTMIPNMCLPSRSILLTKQHSEPCR